MSPSLSWDDLLLRLGLTLVAAGLIGFDRGERGKPAGLRTTVLVALAAAVAMLLANLLLPTVGKLRGSFVQIDVMRLPLGILTGMGFIGGGAILRRRDIVVGITTAATLWFVTVLGLCFGAGRFGLGAVATGIGIGVLWGLNHAERHMRREQRATLVLAATGDETVEPELITRLRKRGYDVHGHTVVLADHGNRRESHFTLQWHAMPDQTGPPDFLSELAKRREVISLRWDPVSL